ncbi:MAG: hypothetical protein R3F62_18175 [Planctomycetota bacterium]
MPETPDTLRAALEAGALSGCQLLGAARLGHPAAGALLGEPADPTLLAPDRPPPPGVERLPPRTLLAWGWVTVSEALGAHAAELRETGVRIPLRGIMLMLWRPVRGDALLPHHSDVALRDTGRLGARGELTPLLREGVLGIHSLARAALAPDAVEAGDPPGSWEWFWENLAQATAHACAADPRQEDPARARLAAWLLAR